MGGRSSQGPRLGCAFYRTDSQREPVRDWLRGLGKEVSKTIGSDILTVQWSWPVGKPLVDALGWLVRDPQYSRANGVSGVLLHRRIEAGAASRNR